ncbi:unnamed protein product [Parnassius mnemosyne]|uniref:Uncharacterized protein n=1 Tax=Parnassius mnemosyne TaxID=213953 RepID=A0AAV1LKI6_9NEOP
MIVRLLSLLCVGILVASVQNAEGNNDNEASVQYNWSCQKLVVSCGVGVVRTGQTASECRTLTSALLNPK